MPNDYYNEQLGPVWPNNSGTTPLVITLDELEDVLRDAILADSASDCGKGDTYFAEIDDYFARDEEESKVQQGDSYLRILATLLPQLAELLGGPLASLHRVNFMFTRLAKGWSCRFTDEDHTRVFRELHFETANEVFDTARQGRAFTDHGSRTQLDAAVARHHGEIQLWLDDEQFRQLTQVT